MDIKPLAEEVVGMIPEEGKLTVLTDDEFQQVVGIAWIFGMISVSISFAANPAFYAGMIELLKAGDGIEDQMIALGGLLERFIDRENRSKA